MDSLADLSSFGVATAVVIYQWLVLGGASPAAAGGVCALVVVCAAIRLARFNVSPSDGRFFRGIPTTMTAAVLAAAVVVGPTVPATVRVVAVAVFAVAMVSSFPYAKLARVLRLPPWLLAVPAIAALVNLPVAFAVVVLGYLASGPLLWWHERRALTRARPAG
jgi:CDP-diacylglycerol--serine O-phosphatidyltransferase